MFEELDLKINIEVGDAQASAFTQITACHITIVENYCYTNARTCG